MKILKSLDIFSFRIDFHYKNQKVFHSIFGLILSLLMYSVMIFFFNYFSKDFFRKSNPMVVFRENEFDRNFSFPIGNLFKNMSYNFFFNDSSNFLGDSYKNRTNVENPILCINIMSVNIKDGNAQKIILNEEVDIIFDNEYKLYNINSDEQFDEYKQILYSEGNVFKKPNIFSKPQLQAIKDVNLKIDENTKLVYRIDFKEKFLDEYMDGRLDITELVLLYIISDNILNVDVKAFFNPYNTRERLYIPDFKYKDFPNKYFFYNYGMIRLINDEGFIMSEENEELNFKRNFYSQSMTSNDFSNKVLFELIIDKVMKTYERKYKKLQNVFADLGGIINSLILFGNLIVYGFNKNKFYYELINNIFGDETNENIKILNESDKFKSKLKDIMNDNSVIKNMNQEINIGGKNDFTSRSISNLNNSEIRIKPTEKNFRKDFRKIMNKKVNDYFTHKIKNKNMTLSKISKISVKQSKFSKEDSMINVELPIIQKEIYDPEKNKFGLGDEDRNFLKIKIEKFLKLHKKNHVTIFFTFCEFLKLLLCCKNFKNDEFMQKENSFKELGKKINEYMNIINYCTLFENFEKLKMIVFNDKQNFSFDFLRNRKMEDISKNNFEMELQKVYKYFNVKREELNDVDLRLLNNFSFNFIDFLN